MQKLTELKKQAQANGWAIEEAHGNTWVVVPRGEFKALLTQLKSQGWNYLADVVGIDYLKYPQPKPERFCVVYELVSLPGYQGGDGSRVFIRVYVPEANPSLPSLTDLWMGADYLEREVFDLLGIRFEGHPDLRKILTPEDLEGHPLRKDFPLGETPTLFKEGRFIDPDAFRAGLSGDKGGMTGWRGGTRKGYQDVAAEVQKVVKGGN
ncbi:MULTISPECIES: NADH-quinone oxidoreductase subunit C [Meiothermus]|mgnify:FL=1|jgi:NADH-quinone oxidoreductase subunit C|uniref:NADH-quinone oxidoreductase subunit C n=1 Tax=Meiothermus ruber (strain ATCC 35948 / DSM 1279 / VKM B-1258 / 21) TaxID=504728 RepID=D3PT49_MEIRD|nr:MULTISPECIES: NADH-quinone oxidoreductase subunit C [Meiothermus]ADD28632.1 NADH (or F420H2) dehydrogenase, subunit C [Meiothermus ruber DSM 1279]AGK05923.1 NADH (or F420H2) dehydrogenase subunit C [Meiothermus ruber DSM 1279]MCL6530238.1 NADH-quinone oxidoreductase subunit C [Meiothermus ruber]GAO75594.1 NADH (or F420H2) dehydrogenase subunit C [Meiothermus ruber H328]